MSIEERLTEHLARIGSAPFLFVGSGLSRRYADLETWEQLLRRFSAQLPRPFAYYHGQANRNLAKTATLIAEAFYEGWWNDPTYQTSRQAFGEQVLSPGSCLKFEISEYLKTKTYDTADAELVNEINLLKTATIDGIITTNWDPGLERLFPDFEVFVGQDQILFSTPQGIAEIYKIHGCSSKPNSLVLTMEDYEHFGERNPYLAAKLMTIFVEHPVIFLGYSLSDENVTSILKQIASCLTNDNIHKLKDQLIFVERDRDNKGDSIQTSVTQVCGHTIPVTIIRTNHFAQVFRPLGSLKRRFPARLLRNMKEHIYELVKANDPKSKLAVLNIEEAESFGDIEIVYGVGVVSKVGQYGYRPLTRFDLFKDVIEPESQYEAKHIVQDTLPSLLRGTRTVPVFRYLRNAGLLASDGKVDTSNLHQRVIKASKAQEDSFYPPKGYEREKLTIQMELKCVNNVVQKYGDNAYYFIPFLCRKQISSDDLREYIIGRMGNEKLMTDTYFCRLFCFYDWLAYGPYID